MLPGTERMNRKQYLALMRHYGITVEDFAAEEVIIRTKDCVITFRDPEVERQTGKGRDVWCVSGSAHFERRDVPPPEPKAIREEDVQLVAQQTGVSLEEARKVLEEEDGEPVHAIIRILSRD